MSIGTLLSSIIPANYSGEIPELVTIADVKGATAVPATMFVQTMSVKLIELRENALLGAVVLYVVPTVARSFLTNAKSKAVLS